MVSQLSSQTPLRRVTRSKSGGPKPAKPGESRRHLKPAPRYAESSTEYAEEETSSTAPECIQTALASPSILLERLFARNCYPSKPRLNIYSETSIVGSLVKSLSGTPEMNCLLGSQFGALFHLPVAHCSNSVKLVHSLLSRQLVTLRRYELWFLFADKPLQFSLREFCDITGLKCEPEVEKVGNDTPSDDVTAGHMWRELFETEELDVTVSEVLVMLEQPSLPQWKRMPLALIVLVNGLLVCGHKHLQLTPSYIEMLEDTESFLQYPWGREAFLSTLSRLTPPKHASPSKMGKSFAVMRVVVTFSIPDEGGDPKWKEELKTLRDELFSWVHPNGRSGQPDNRGGSFTVSQSKAQGKKPKHNSPDNVSARDLSQKRRYKSVVDDTDDADIGGSECKKQKKTSGDGLGDDQTTMHDYFRDDYTHMMGLGKRRLASNAPAMEETPSKLTVSEEGEIHSGDEAPMSGLSLLVEQVEKKGGSDHVDKEPQKENRCLIITIWAKPEAYVLPIEDVTDAQEGQASRTNSEDYKTPPEDAPMSELRTPEVGKGKIRRYSTRSAKKEEREGTCIPISSTKREEVQRKRISKRSTKIGGVYTPDKRFKILIQSCKKPKYTPLADVEQAKFKEFEKILRENRKQEFLIVTGVRVLNQFFLSLARPRNWVTTKHIAVLISMLWRRHGGKYLKQRCRFVYYYSISGILTRFTEFEKAPDKLKYDWGRLVSCFVTGKSKCRNDKMELLRDVDRVYAPMLWGKDHWSLFVNHWDQSRAPIAASQALPSPDLTSVNAQLHREAQPKSSPSSLLKVDTSLVVSLLITPSYDQRTKLSPSSLSAVLSSARVKPARRRGRFKPRRRRNRRNLQPSSNQAMNLLRLPRTIPRNLLEKCFAEENPGTALACLSRQFLERVGKVVRGHQWGWGMIHNDMFLTKQDDFMANVIPAFYSCQCTPRLETVWDLWHIENTKGKNKCRRCFLIQEVGFFFRDFEPMHPMRDTRLW
ncbi:hypothetical protein Bca4012_020443 [Brassica carinata]